MFHLWVKRWYREFVAWLFHLEVRGIEDLKKQEESEKLRYERAVTCPRSHSN